MEDPYLVILKECNSFKQKNIRKYRKLFRKCYFELHHHKRKLWMKKDKSTSKKYYRANSLKHDFLFVQNAFIDLENLLLQMEYNMYYSQTPSNKKKYLQHIIQEINIDLQDVHKTNFYDNIDYIHKKWFTRIHKLNNVYPKDVFIPKKNKNKPRICSDILKFCLIICVCLIIVIVI